MIERRQNDGGQKEETESCTDEKQVFWMWLREEDVWDWCQKLSDIPPRVWPLIWTIWTTWSPRSVMNYPSLKFSRFWPFSSSSPSVLTVIKKLLSWTCVLQVSPFTISLKQVLVLVRLRAYWDLVLLWDLLKTGLLFHKLQIMSLCLFQYGLNLILV